MAYSADEGEKMGRVPKYVPENDEDVKANRIAKWALVISILSALVSGWSLYAENRVNLSVDSIDSRIREGFTSTYQGQDAEVVGLLEAANSSTLILRNDSRRDIGISALLFKDGERESYASIAGPDQFGTIDIKAGGSIVLTAFLCTWITAIVDSSQDPETVEAYFVTGFGDREIDLPEPVIESLKTGVEEYTRLGSEYSSRCTDATMRLSGSSVSLD